LRSQLDLPRRFEWDATGYFVSSLLVNQGAGSFPISQYWRLDTRAGWRATRNLEFSVTGQNLLAPSRFEFPQAQQVLSTAVQRTVLAKATWHF
jgi:outer membrane receptor for monomeric catechols